MPERAERFEAMLHGPAIIIALLFLLLFLAVWFQIYRKAGYSGFLCLLMVIPLVNLLTVLWFAFLAKWPATRQSSTSAAS